MRIAASFLYARKMFFSRDKFSEQNHGRKSLLGAMLCIGISLIPLVSVLVVSDGMIEGMMGRIIGLSSGHLEVRFSARSDTLKNYDDFISTADRMLKIEGVEQAFPEIQGTALAVGLKGRTGATVRGVDPEIFTKNKSYQKLFQVVEGETNLSESNSCVIGEYLAKNLDLHTGDTLRIINVSIGSSSRVLPKFTAYKISGIVSSGYQELDALWVFIPLKKAFESMSINTAQYLISMTTADPFSSELYKIRRALKNEVAGFGEGDAIEGANVYSWQELNSSQYANFSSTQILLLLIMLLIVIVASVNVASALIMLVMERKKEIAILRSTGATSGGITLSFIFTGLACGLGGILIGIPVGLLCAVNVNSIITFAEKVVNLFARFFYLLANHNLSSFRNVSLLDPAYYIQDFTITIPFGKLFMITAGTLVLSLIVSAIPAIKAGKEKPIETLRKI